MSCASGCVRLPRHLLPMLQGSHPPPRRMPLRAHREFPARYRLPIPSSCRISSFPCIPCRYQLGQPSFPGRHSLCMAIGHVDTCRDPTSSSSPQHHVLCKESMSLRLIRPVHCMTHRFSSSGCSPSGISQQLRLLALLRLP